MEQNRKPRSKTQYIWSINLQQASQEHTKGRKVTTRGWGMKEWEVTG